MSSSAASTRPSASVAEPRLHATRAGAEAAYRTSVFHRILPARKAQTALITLEQDVARLQSAIATHRPDLVGVPWDLTVRGDRAVITGPVPAADRAWLADRLDASPTLHDAVAAYAAAAIDYLETSEDNPPYLHPNGMDGGRPQHYDFSDVAGQLEHVMAFRSLLERLKTYADAGTQARSVADNPYCGCSSFDWVAARLSAAADPAAQAARLS